MSERLKEIRDSLDDKLLLHRDAYSLYLTNIPFLLSEIERVQAERDELAEHKRLLFDETGRLLAEKEAGMWDKNHPVWKERDRLRQALDHAKKVIREHSACGQKHLAEVEGIECGNVADGGPRCKACNGQWPDYKSYYNHDCSQRGKE